MTVAWRSGSAGALQAQGRGFKSLRDHHRKRRKTPFQMGFFFSMALCRRIASWQNLADECPVRRVGEFRQGFSSAGFGRRIRGPVGSWADSHSWRARRVSQRAPLVAPPSASAMPPFRARSTLACGSSLLTASSASPGARSRVAREATGRRLGRPPRRRGNSLACACLACELPGFRFPAPAPPPVFRPRVGGGAHDGASTERTEVL